MPAEIGRPEVGAAGGGAEPGMPPRRVHGSDSGAGIQPGANRLRSSIVCIARIRCDIFSALTGSFGPGVKPRPIHSGADKTTTTDGRKRTLAMQHSSHPQPGRPEDKRPLAFPDNEAARHLFGEHNSNLQRIATALDLHIHTRGGQVVIEGEPIIARLAENILKQLYELLESGYPIYPKDVDYAVRVLSENDRVRLKDIFLDTVFITAKKSPITPKSPNQKAYIDAMRQFDIVFGIGPAGTGKTYLAMAMAVSALTKKQVSRIILTRPAVEAGEELGFLPGDLAEKVDPYLRPLYDALHDMMRLEKAAGLVQQGVIEVAPLAFMRGRTLNDSFIILDEAQNTTAEQMKMFLTRIGYNAKAVITGDITQVDLPAGRTSGLIQTKNILQRIEGIRFVYFTKKDVVRHPLVQEIIRAYEELEARTNAETEA